MDPNDPSPAEESESLDRGRSTQADEVTRYYEDASSKGFVQRALLRPHLFEEWTSVEKSSRSSAEIIRPVPLGGEIHEFANIRRLESALQSFPCLSTEQWSPKN